MHVKHSWECMFNIYCLGVGGGGVLRQRASVKFLKSVEMGRGRGCVRVRMLTLGTLSKEHGRFLYGDRK